MNDQHKAITLVKNAIHNPSEPRHFMTLTKLSDEFCVTVNGVKLTQSKSVMAMHEVAHIIIDPVLYFPESDINWELLSQNDKVTQCPLKGDARYFDYSENGEKILNIAWSYPAPISIAQIIKGYIAFDSRYCDCIKMDKIDS